MNITAYCGPGTLGLAPHEFLADGAFDASIGQNVPLTDDTSAVVGAATVDAVEINEDRRSVHVTLTVDAELDSGGLRRVLRAAGIARLITEGAWSPGITLWTAALDEAAARWRDARRTSPAVLSPEEDTAPTEIHVPESVPVRGPAASLRDVLRAHYLAQVVCDHERKQDNPVCACSLVNLGWHPSAGEAVDAWIDHVVAELAVVPAPPPAEEDPR